MLRKFYGTVVEYREGSTLKRATRMEFKVRAFGAAALNGNVAAAEALLALRSKGVEFGELSTTIIMFDEADARFQTPFALLCMQALRLVSWSRTETRSPRRAVAG